MRADAPLKCYRVWFRDGSAVLVDAESPGQAREGALLIARGNGDPSPSVARIECLD